MLSLAGGTVLLLLGICSILLGVVFVIDAGMPDTEMTISTALCAMFLGLPFAASGGLLVYIGLRAHQRQHQEASEARVLQAAITRNYRITATEVAMLTDLSLAEAQTYLETQARGGLVSVEVGTDGILIYHFRD
jgi:uncharacterized membrane protein HdeD (DUF308 family)